MVIMGLVVPLSHCRGTLGVDVVGQDQGDEKLTDDHF